MRKRNGVHLVMPGKMGPITVFFMPGEMTEAEMPVQFGTLQRPDRPDQLGQYRGGGRKRRTAGRTG